MPLLRVRVCTVRVPSERGAGSAAPLVGPELVVAVAVVDGVDGDARGDDLIDAVQHVGAEGDVGCGQDRVELLHGARADDRGGDTGVVDDEGDGQLDQRETGLFGQDGELFDGVELALVAGGGHVEPRGWPGGGGRGGGGVLAPAAGEPASGQRAVGEGAHAAALDGREDVFL